MITLPCISLWQPFASLLFVASPEWRKAHETRSFAFPERFMGERIAIQAAKKPMADAHISRELHELCVRALGPLYRSTLPLGAVIGTLEVNQWIVTDFATPESPADLVAGDWRPGRYAWKTESPQLLAKPLPIRGRQRWFSVCLEATDAAR